jgi:Transposase DDE domain
MFMAEVFNRFVEKAPVAVMARASLEYALQPAPLDALFAVHAQRQYERTLLFSTMLDLTALVVCGVHPSVHAAYKVLRKQVPVSLTAVYDKLAGVEPSTTEALVAHSAERLRPVIEALGPAEPWLPGYRVRLLDGNHLAASERRLKVLRKCAAGPLPGQSLVVLEPEVGLVVQMVACEDGHAQERSLLQPIIAAAGPSDVYIADRNFCTLGFLFGLANREAHFVIRQHAHLPIESCGTLRRRGRTDSGEVFEQPVTLRMGEATLAARRVVIRLDVATRDGDTEMAIITDLPPSVSAGAIADVYRRRWTIETLFARVERNLQNEIAALGYPKAALFGFGVALVAANVFAVVFAALQTAKRSDQRVVDMPLSDFAIVHAARSAHDGMSLVLDDDVWELFHEMAPRTFAKRLVAWARNTDWQRFRKAVRGPKKPVPKRTRFKGTPHVSTARLLAE